MNSLRNFFSHQASTNANRAFGYTAFASLVYNVGNQLYERKPLNEPHFIKQTALKTVLYPAAASIGVRAVMMCKDPFNAVMITWMSSCTVSDIVVKREIKHLNEETERNNQEINRMNQQIACLESSD